ncbi:MAG: glycosyltransferase family 39 protein [Chthoniobacteraceae bacterium]
MSFSNNPQTQAAGSSTSSTPSIHRIHWLGLALTLVFLLVIFGRPITLPWTEEDNYYGALYSQAAHNNLRAGLWVTGSVPSTLYFGPLPIPPDQFYVHHPSLLPLSVTAAFAVFGEHEWAARLVPIFCSLASLTFLWLIVAHAVGARAATFTGLVFAFMPMELHYGDVVNFEPCTMTPMLAALWGIQRWQATARLGGAWFAALGCLLSLWMDWPGYLFTLSLAGWLLWRPGARWMAGVLLLLVLISGTGFMLQIRWVNADAWSNLWTALMVRVGNGVTSGSDAVTTTGPHFTTVEWLATVGRNIFENFHPLPLALALVGTVILLLRRRAAAGLRWLGWAALSTFTTGVVYVVIFRNESFIHDFAPFYLIAAIAMTSGLALDTAWEAVARQSQAIRFLSRTALVALLAVLATLGCRSSQAMRSQSLILDGDTPEPANLIPALGQQLHDTFTPNTVILLNIDPYGSTLNYYTQRSLLNNLDTADDWKGWMAEVSPAGGVIWLDAPGAAQILAALPASEIQRIKVEGIPFAFWVPANARATAK